MKQYAVEYWGFMTILAESEEKARAKFATVDHGPDSDYAEIRTIDYMCEVEKRIPQNRGVNNIIRGIRRALCAVMLLFTGCAEHGAVYWSEKDGAVTVHHVSGKTDQIQKLVKKPSGDGYQVVSDTIPYTPPAKKLDSKLETKIEKLTAKVESLEEKLARKSESRPEAKQEPSKIKVPIDLRNSTASDRPDPRPAEVEAAPDEPRMSQ